MPRLNFGIPDHPAKVYRVSGPGRASRARSVWSGITHISEDELSKVVSRSGFYTVVHTHTPSTMAGLFQPVSALRLLARPGGVAPRSMRTFSTLRSMSSHVSVSAHTRPRAAYPAAGYFGPSYLPFSSSKAFSFFTPSRFVSSSSSSSAAPASTSAATDASVPKPEDVRTIPKSLPTWLLGCSALVFGIIVIGGLTRLTESGLSIVEWNPITGVRPPITDAEWDAEWEKYRLSPEGIMINSEISRAEFKKIFYMEWAHRIAGRTLGLV